MRQTTTVAQTNAHRGADARVLRRAPGDPLATCHPRDRSRAPRPNRNVERPGPLTSGGTERAAQRVHARTPLGPHPPRRSVSPSARRVGDADLGAMSAPLPAPSEGNDGEEADLGDDEPNGIDPFEGDESEDTDETTTPGVADADDDSNTGMIEDEAPVTPPKAAAPKPLQPIRVMTYNVRHPTSEDSGIYAWSKRKAAVVARIGSSTPADPSLRRRRPSIARPRTASPPRITSRSSQRSAPQSSRLPRALRHHLPEWPRLALARSLVAPFSTGAWGDSTTSVILERRVRGSTSTTILEAARPGSTSATILEAARPGSTSATILERRVRGSTSTTSSTGASSTSASGTSGLHVLNVHLVDELGERRRRARAAPRRGRTLSPGGRPSAEPDRPAQRARRSSALSGGSESERDTIAAEPTLASAPSALGIADAEAKRGSSSRRWHQPQTRPASPSGSPSAAARADAGISSRRPASPRGKRKRCTAATESSSRVRRAPREPRESEDKM